MKAPIKTSLLLVMLPDVVAVDGLAAPAEAFVPVVSKHEVAATPVQDSTSSVSTNEPEKVAVVVIVPDRLDEQT